MNIPTGFKLIRQNECLLEFKSAYHFWCIYYSYEHVMLVHKYNLSDEYHKQGIFADSAHVIRYVKRHDIAYARRINT